ncbi:MAG: copper chaperone, partial [Flavobacteriaceae bacterium]|nr:copper chaperone [Flavobacteriaceae bacterium]
MKTTFKIIFAVLIGAFIGYSIADYTLTTDEVEIVNEDKVENIIELMGTETSFGVKGNCKMCKKTIETSALSLDGVHKAIWDVKTKQIDLVYDDQ